MADIVRDEAIRSGDPCIAGTRISVFDVKRRVVDCDEDPLVVAGDYDVPIADVFRALAYYYDHRDYLAEREDEFRVARRKGQRRTRELVAASGDCEE